jgi:uncharacterized protein (TIGR03435 family)
MYTRTLFRCLIAAAAASAIQPAQLRAQIPSFEVANIKPNDPVRNPNVVAGWSATRSGLRAVGSVRALIRQAYDVEDERIAGGPKWFDSDVFEIDAKSSAPANPGELRVMLQSLLAERFNLRMHSETRQLSIYSLVVAKNGSKLQPASEPGGVSSGPTLLRGTMDASAIARSLTSALGRNVIDNTGLKGTYKLDLTWAPDARQDGPSIFTAIQEQLGLKLESIKGPVQVFVIDRATLPTPN